MLPALMAGGDLLVDALEVGGGLELQVAASL